MNEDNCRIGSMSWSCNDPPPDARLHLYHALGTSYTCSSKQPASRNHRGMCRNSILASVFVSQDIYQRDAMNEKRIDEESIVEKGVMRLTQHQCYCLLYKSFFSCASYAASSHIYEDNKSWNDHYV